MSSPPQSKSVEKVKRGYRACLHCRSRKAKCDLGDIDSPSSPPCGRCRRESRECVFAPSRRGGNTVKREKEGTAAEGEGEHDDPEVDPKLRHSSSSTSVAATPLHPAHIRPSISAPSHPYSQQRDAPTFALPHAQPYGPLRSSIEYDPPFKQPQAYGSSLQDLLRSPQTNPYPLHPAGQGQGQGHGPAQVQAHGQGQGRERGQGQEYGHGDGYEQVYGHGHGSRPVPNYSPVQSRDPPMSPASGNLTTQSRPNSMPQSSSLSLGHPHAPTHTRPEPSQTPSPKRRRLHLNPPLHAADPSSIVVADMQNESDALHILALASGRTDGPAREASDEAEADSRPGKGEVARSPAEVVRGKVRKGKELADFALIKLGIVSRAQVVTLAERFFKYHHHLFPMVPSAIIPRTPEQLGHFGHNERYLLAAIVIIASRHDSGEGMREVHDKAWAVMRGWISDIQFLGAPPTIGLVEALLLLAENLPRDPARSRSKRNEPNEIHAIGFGEEAHGAENRQAWMLIGVAIRCAYGLEIDKLANKLFTAAERTLELERARLAWTYCYLFDRHVSLRLGKAFWSRGPASICFQGFSASAQTGPAAATDNFPFLREIKPSDQGGAHPQEDLAGLVQAYLELTQMMSNAHDCLYPNEARTRSLVLYGEYFKYIDELTRSLDGFKVLWGQKRWNVFPLHDAVWAMFYYTQLYICAFSFQAHVERAAMRADEESKILEQQHNAEGSHADFPRPPLSLFPRGAAASPDARYILQSCDAARMLLHICVDSLHPGGALPFLPSRYLLWFTYAAIFLLKALYSGAMLRADHAETLKLIDRLCICFAQTWTDDDHPAVRYAQQLDGLRKKLGGMSDPADPSSPTGGHQVPLPPMSATATNSRSGTSNPTPLSGGPAHPAYSEGDSSMPYSTSPAWAFPIPIVPPAPISFAYPNTPAATASVYVAPPHQQPFSEVNSLQMAEFGQGPSQGHGHGPQGLGQGQGQGQGQAPQQGPGESQHLNNLGFATIEDWFGQVDASDEATQFAGLDLDFWTKVGPGEGGFPFR